MHKGYRERCNPSKYFHKLGHKNAVKLKNMKPPDFITTPCTPAKEFENDCASMSLKI
jgi:hypothetical protein